MVMEAKPSPLVVGSEFVRQYYTLLHNSPDHLHRFYNQHSSFTHGGLDHDPSKKEDVLIIGQKNIHDKIQQLKFSDCHAKISSVDAQATLGDGVVVQVSGELSNDGHPMRRFTQTFVLACQSPKKYYVHNDIFRYQDMYNEDDDARVCDDHDNNESNVTTSTDSAGSVIVQPSAVFYQHPPGNVVVSAITTPTIIPYPQGIPQGQAPAQVNGVIHDEMLKNMSTQTSTTPQPIIANVPTTIIAAIPIAPAATALPMPIEPVAVVTPEIVNQAPVVTEVHQFEAEIVEDSDKEKDDIIETPSAPAASAVPAAPKNWANLVKSSGGSFNASFQPETPVTPQATPFAAITQQQQHQANKEKTTESQGNGERRPPRANEDRRERRTSSNYNQEGNCQLFLGNLPQRATEEELRQMFSVFGKIADLRIHNKPQQKNSNNRPVPNYGFITFEDPASAIKLQEATPIFYPSLRDSSGQKLNVELKIRKEGGNPPRSSNGGPNMERGRNNNPGGGMNRNGSDGRGDRRDGGNRQYQRSDRNPMGGRGANGATGANGQTAPPQHANNTRR